MLARLMRAEAEGEGELGMLMAENVMVNRARVNCPDFQDVNSIEEWCFNPLVALKQHRKATFIKVLEKREIRLARKVINGERHHPAEFALWFFRPGRILSCSMNWGKWNSGRYKLHCFYTPLATECPSVY
ncbi:cell wall hydrolase [Anaerobacillus sp. HL2]|nr:cell wall hydrolase [Anaerobacillus sp. HL2]